MSELDFTYKNVACSQLSDDEVVACANLFSCHYGVWSTTHDDVNKRGQRVRMSAMRFRRMYVDKPGRYIAMVYANEKLIGQAVYIRSKLQKKYRNKHITWVLQLVVDKAFRGHGLGSKLLYSIWGFSDDFAWGLFTPNHFTLKALERATGRRISLGKIEKMRHILRPVAEGLFNDMVWFDGFDKGCVDTHFDVNISECHSYQEDDYWEPDKHRFPFRNLKSGEEWFAFVFSSQRHESDSLVLALETSEEILKSAYSRMQMVEHKWASHADREIDYFLSKGYITKDSNVLDVGCGIGRHVHELAKRGIRAKGIDFLATCIAKAKSNIVNPNLESFEVDDAQFFNEDKKYDLVLCLYDVVGSYTDNKKNMIILDSCRQCLTRDGRLILSVMNLDAVKIREFNAEEDLRPLDRLSPSSTMQDNGDIFNPRFLLKDKVSGVVYHKEQFNRDGGLPAEYLIGDRRWTVESLSDMLHTAGFEIVECKCVRAGKFDVALGKTDKHAKEILVVARKRRNFWENVLGIGSGSTLKR